MTYDDQPSSGFALLSVLVVTALAMIAVGGLLSAASGVASLAHDDADGIPRSLRG